MKRLNYISFIVLFYLLIFQNFLEKNINSVFGYLDELYAVTFIIVFGLKKKNTVVIRRDLYIFLAFIILNLIGLLSSFFYKLQPIKFVLMDLIIMNKFVFTVYTSANLFKDLLNEQNERKILFHCKLLTVIFFILEIIDYIFNIFDGESRYGIKAMQLFYSHPTYLCAIAIFILITMFMCRKDKKEFKYYIILSFIIVSTLRTKAFIFTAIVWILYLMIIVNKKQLKLTIVVALALLAFFIGESQFEMYFIENNSARSMLLFKSFEIAKDYFPLGAGFATFGSSISAVSYSTLYYTYGLSGKYGLSPDYPMYISDNFWPMIIGQFGFFGLIIYIFFLYNLYKKIQSLYNLNLDVYIAALSAMVYLIIMSTSVSAFVASTAIPLAMIIGICACSNKKNSDE